MLNVALQLVNNAYPMMHAEVTKMGRGCKKKKKKIQRIQEF
jgi:hypothetical protein